MNDQWGTMVIVLNCRIVRRGEGASHPRQRAAHRRDRAPTTGDERFYKCRAGTADGCTRARVVGRRRRREGQDLPPGGAARRGVPIGVGQRDRGDRRVLLPEDRDLWRRCARWIIVPGPYRNKPLVRQANRHTWRALLASGVEVHEFQPSMVHAKTLVVDGASHWSDQSTSTRGRSPSMRRAAS